MTSNQKEVKVRIEDLAVVVLGLLVDDLVVEDVIHACAADWLTSSHPSPGTRRWAHNL